jgi:hypothetical protein
MHLFTFYLQANDVDKTHRFAPITVHGNQRFASIFKLEAKVPCPINIVGNCMTKMQFCGDNTKYVLP